MVPSKKLKTYREAIGQYHLSPESKFLNGDFTDRGRTERRHVQVTDVIHIGKEANKWKEGHVNAFTIAICSAMNAALEAAFCELCLNFVAAIGAVGPNVRSRVAHIENIFELLTVVHTRRRGTTSG